MYAASLALFRDIHSQMFLGLPLLFWWKQNVVPVIFRSWKVDVHVDDPKQKPKLTTNRRGNQGNYGPACSCTVRGLEQISFPSLFVDGQNPTPNLIGRTLYILGVFAIATGASFCLPHQLNRKSIFAGRCSKKNPTFKPAFSLALTCYTQVFALFSHDNEILQYNLDVFPSIAVLIFTSIPFYYKIIFSISSFKTN